MARGRRARWRRNARLVQGGHILGAHCPAKTSPHYALHRVGEAIVGLLICDYAKTLRRMGTFGWQLHGTNPAILIENAQKQNFI